MAAITITNMNLIPKIRPFPSDFPLRRRNIIKGKSYNNCVSSSSIKITNIGLDHLRNHSPKLTKDHQSPSPRRSGNYSPPHWDFDYIQSLDTEYAQEERHLVRLYELKMEVKKMLEVNAIVDQLNLIDDLQRLGICYHFEDDIMKVLTNIYEQKYIQDVVDETKEKDLYSTALEFRLLRQHGFTIPQDIFDSFKDEKGNFKSIFEKDTKGLLQLYEASYLLIEGENTLELAREFSSKHLHEMQNNMNLDDNDDDDGNLMSLLVTNALEMPLHWRVQRPNVRWFIDEYEKRKDKNSSVVLELAKLDFNIVQAKHQHELKQASSWWRGTSFAEKLPFARDRLVENYFWTIGCFFDPKFGYTRVTLTKVNALITTIDDVYDVYGTLEELERFTDVIKRWDIDGMDELPSYMQICFLALNNFVNDMAYDFLKEKGIYIIPYLRQSWIDLCTAYLQEAKWYFEGYTPTLEEYIENAWTSISAPAILCHAFFPLTNPMGKETVESISEYGDIIRLSGMILRLADDLGTSSEELQRGDVPKSIQCFMNESGASEMEAREHIKYLIYETWKKMNKELVQKRSQFSKYFVRSAADLGRMAQCMYEHGDGHGINQNSHIKQRIFSLLFEPIN